MPEETENVAMENAVEQMEDEGNEDLNCTVNMGYVTDRRGIFKRGIANS